MKDIYYVKDLEQLKVLSDPLRVKILWELDYGAQTGKMLSVKLNLPASKMRYHLTALEKAGLVEIERTEVINGIVQKFYRPIAKEISLEKVSPIISKQEKATMEHSLAANALEGLKRTQQLLKNRDRDNIRTDELTQYFLSVSLNDENFQIAKEKTTELIEFMKEHDHQSDMAKTYHVNITGFQTNDGDK